MTPDLQREFQTLSDLAHKTLREVPVCGSMREVFSLWIFPSFQPSSCCTVHTPRPNAKGRPPTATISTWRSDLDLEKLRSPVERLKYPDELTPTFQNVVINLSAGDITDLESRLAKVTVPIYLGREVRFGLDGTSYEFTYGRFSSGATLRWWSDLPSEWRPLTSVILQIYREITARVPSR